MRDIDASIQWQEDTVLRPANDACQEFVFAHDAERLLMLIWTRTGEPVSPGDERILATTRIFADDDWSGQFNSVITEQRSYIV
ncbi:hypothetical protein C475_21999 [Halosimplex carlsbadense 2-9-1]|uniref:Uncharacterized protein n=1 Tax=Halosimplex carlsbadense 2-9-1 TaxID=797114 RepID=M0CAM4_9EURY|nr:hypothetical protein C475_21999 [Halosimplex carlsbadense 2-9-1]